MNYTLTQLKLAELYKIQLSSGTYLYYTRHNTDLTYQSNIYKALPIKRSSISYYSNLQIDKVDLNIGLVGVTVGAGSYTIPQVIERGWLRKAHIWVYLVDWSLLNSDTLIFEGFITGAISYNQGILSLEVNSILDKLNVQFPKKIYTELCSHSLYEIGIFTCNVAKATFKVTGSVTSSADKFTISSSTFNFSSHASGWWLGGKILLTSGSNNGVERSIIKHLDGSIGVITAFPDTIAASVTFDVYPGCNKTGVICESKFNNFSNFFGFELIPKPETLYGV